MRARTHGRYKAANEGSEHANADSNMPEAVEYNATAAAAPTCTADAPTGQAMISLQRRASSKSRELPPWPSE